MDTHPDQIIARYSELARAAQAGHAITDCEPGDSGDACLGAAAYSGADASPDTQQALRASLGCGNPLAVADLRPGDDVLDLGSGGGLDVLLSARRVGPDGTAYGLDASTDMLALARANAARAQVSNAQLLHGRIEDIPLPAGQLDVIISNCVINLSADKPRVLTEAYRVLKPGGRLGIADVIASDSVNSQQRARSEQQIGCAAGTLTNQQYRTYLQAAGFTRIRITATGSPGPGLRAAIIQAVKPAP